MASFCSWAAKLHSAGLQAMLLLQGHYRDGTLSAATGLLLQSKFRGSTRHYSHRRRIEHKLDASHCDPQSDPTGTLARQGCCSVASTVAFGTTRFDHGVFDHACRQICHRFML